MTDEELRLRGEIAELEGRLRAQSNATKDAAKTADIALERVQRWEPVVVAARALALDLNNVTAVFSLLEAVENLPPEGTPS